MIYHQNLRPVRSFQKCKPYVLINYTHQNIQIFNILPVNILPIKKETYYSNVHKHQSNK